MYISSEFISYFWVKFSFTPTHYVFSKTQGTVKLNNITYDVGGIQSGISRAYLNRSALHNEIKPRNDSFQYIGYELQDPVAPYPYKPKRGAPENIEWPPKGLHVLFKFRAPMSSPQSHKDIHVIVHYEIYIGKVLDRIRDLLFH